MNQHCFLKVIVCLGFFLPAVCPGQFISRTAYVEVQEVFQGDGTNRSFLTNLAGAGSLRGLERTLPRSGSYARASAVADASALRFSGKGSHHATLFNGEGRTFAYGYGGVQVSDSIYLTSPSVPNGAHAQATAHIRLVVSSEETFTGTVGSYNTSVDINLANFRTQFGYWGTNQGLPNGEFFIDMPAYVDGPNPPYAVNHLNLTATAGTSGFGGLQPSGPSFSSSASCSFTLTWGGIVSLKLDDGTVISDFQATGISGASYRSQRPRPDQTSSISKASPSALALQWAGTSNTFYQVESTTSLGAGSWAPQGEAVEGNGTNSLMETLPGTGHRFFRVVDAPLP